MSGFNLNEFTAEERAALLKDLKEAYALGATRVRFRERDVIYRSRDEMLGVITDIERAINGSPKQRVVMTTFHRGY